MPGLILLAAFALVLGVVLVCVLRRRPPTPVEIERRRRSILSAKGKLGDANLVDMRDNVVFYSYSVRGVGYTASQDVSGFQHLFSSQPGALIGPVYVKYDPRNPANSILVAEEWSGLLTTNPRS
jgi:hypothetical protein